MTDISEEAVAELARALMIAKGGDQLVAQWLWENDAVTSKYWGDKAVALLDKITPLMISARVTELEAALAAAEQRAAEARADERERCAKVAEIAAKPYVRNSLKGRMIGMVPVISRSMARLSIRIAAAIRAGGEG